MLIIILPLLFDYLETPFELIKTNKEIATNSKKYKITLKSKKKIDKQILSKYRFKKLDLCNDNSINDNDLKYLKNIHMLNLDCNRN